MQRLALRHLLQHPFGFETRSEAYRDAGVGQGASFDFETLHVQITRVANHHVEQIRVAANTDTHAETDRLNSIA